MPVVPDSTVKGGASLSLLSIRRREMFGFN
jgi:hypothetical protein